MPEPVLCYVDYPWAYFTTQPLEKQWGDDWDDAPYEHNAGRPYEPLAGEDYEISKVAFEGPFDSPREGLTNSPYCVMGINRGAIAWLRPTSDCSNKKAKPIHAGVMLPEFIRLIELGGGSVYIKHE